MIALKLPFTFDVSRILNEIRQIPQTEFVDLYSINIAEGSVQALHLIEPATFAGNTQENVRFEPTPRLQKLPYLHSILQDFPSPKETFRIHKLMPGGQIRKHRDMTMNFEQGLFRMHIPVQVNDRSFFNLFGENIPMQPGECWYVDIDLPHYVENHGKTERIHLIMDCQKNEWWENVFAQAGYQYTFPNPYSRMETAELLNMKAFLVQNPNEQNQSLLMEVEREIEQR